MEWNVLQVVESQTRTIFSPAAAMSAKTESTLPLEASKPHQWQFVPGQYLVTPSMLKSNPSVAANAVDDGAEVADVIVELLDLEVVEEVALVVVYLVVVDACGPSGGTRYRPCHTRSRRRRGGRRGGPWVASVVIRLP